MTSTFELVDLIKDVIPAPARRTGGNPAKRTFQALRIAVNNELQILEKAIPQAMAALVVGGRILVLSYHSLEDRIVKNAFKEQSSIIDALPGLPILLSKSIAPFELVTRKAEQASDEEIAGGLFVNTLLSQGQYQIQELQNQSIALADEHEILAQNVSRMESPEVLKNKAIEIGMIPSAGSAFIDLRDGRLMGAGVDPILNEPDPNVVTPVSTP